MNKVVEFQQVTKAYGDVTAVKDISFTMEPGKIYGLLGRNGAGKTTIMHMITAQLFASSGEVNVFGETPYENNRVLSKLCFIKESQKYPDNFRVIDVLKVAAALYTDWDQAYAETLMRDFSLPHTRRVKKLSRGMLSSLGIIVGLASRAPLTLFDEPYLGLDAVARGIFYDRLIEDYAEHPRTIILSTHLIDEASRMLEHVIVIDQGKLILDEEADSIRGRAFTVVGPKSSVEPYAADREVIHRETFGGFVSLTVMGNLYGDDRKQAEALGLEIAPVSLQQLIVHLTNDKSGRKAEVAQ
ncbi:ABC transporter ATP-binding protein [Paenibacillus ginsengarvi]|uniref:ABC transporter ATP-binding protein n=1 Tax=Paenibacillus ginsengarvi TaxID=400777 RepID=A0A3B0CRZ9_9BACL|nr:ABC transporter ATP-binding protein [Paenibacillus ginsengarvi]RKN86810.1 ABC transporter ATP-binding protein [Paenibacillus ginsengarvi]